MVTLPTSGDSSWNSLVTERPYKIPYHRKYRNCITSHIMQLMSVRLALRNLAVTHRGCSNAGEDSEDTYVGVHLCVHLELLCVCWTMNCIPLNYVCVCVCVCVYVCVCACIGGEGGVRSMKL